MRKGLLIALIFIISSFSAIATSSVVITPIDNHIGQGDVATYNLKLTNLEKESARFSLYSLQSGQGWIIEPTPLKDKIMILGPEAMYETTITVKPSKDFNYGQYGVTLNIDSDTGERHQELLQLYYGPTGQSEYVANIKTEIDMDEKVLPGEATSIKLLLENRNPKNLADLTVRMQSEMEEFSKEVTIDLPPLQEKLIQFTVTPDKFRQPKDYVVFFIFEHNGKQVQVTPKKISVISSSPDFSKEVSAEMKYLKRTGVLKVTNMGNVKNSQTVVMPIGFWQSIFTFSDGDVESTDAGRFVTWDITLSPEESIDLPFTTNYRVFVYILSLVLLVLGFYYGVKSPLVLHKKAVAVKSGDSSLSELKVTLELMNRSKKQIKDIEIIDFVPAIANVEKSLELGTLRPKEIKHTKRGTKVHWVLAELDAHEHRLITYKVKAKLNILGTFSLPRGTVEYKSRKKKKKAYSNTFRLGI